jgi:phosphonate transport system substrate-binding protein
MRPIFLTIICLAFLSLLTSCGMLSTPTPTAIPPTPVPIGRALVLGDISDDPAEVIDGTQPLANYLAAQLKDYGITEGKVRVVSSTEEMINLLKNGEIDLYCDSTYPATLISDASGAKLILRRWRFGVEKYHSVIFASKASGITKLEDLPGHMLAMDAPYSTSGFLLPAVHLLEKGFTLTGKKAYGAPVAGKEIGFVFSYDDENTLQWVLSGLVSAGVTDDYNFDQAFPPEATEKLVLLARTESTPRQVVVARSGLDPNLLEAIKQSLVKMHENEIGKAALKPFQTSKFDEFPDGIETATARMRKMMELVKDIALP